MRWYEEFPQPKDVGVCPACKSSTCRHSPSGQERERTDVLRISREKMREQQQQESCCRSVESKKSKENELRRLVAVRNTVRRLERDINAEIMAAFFEPAKMG